jgi:hypothetical protein
MDLIVAAITNFRSRFKLSGILPYSTEENAKIREYRFLFLGWVLNRSISGLLAVRVILGCKVQAMEKPNTGYILSPT